LLVERGGATAIVPLTRLAETAKAHGPGCALWTLDGLDRITPELVIKALEDSSRDVRMSAIRLAERWLPGENQPIRVAVMRRMEDADWQVREQLAASLGALPVGPREAAVVTVLERYDDDPVVMDAALSGLRSTELAALQKLLQSAGQTPQREAAITMIAGTIVRGAQDAAVQQMLQWATEDSRPGWQRSALLRGAEVALLGASLPGTVGRRGGNGNPTTRRLARRAVSSGGRAGREAGAFAQVPAGARAGGRGGPLCG
jgi:hypothetical protein